MHTVLEEKGMNSDRFKVLFGRRLRFLRQLESLTQAELAEKAGISLEHVNKIERGAAAPSMASVLVLAQALETEPANLFLFSDSPMAWAADKNHQPDMGEPAVDWTKFVTRIGTWERNMVTGDMIWSDSLYRLLGFEPGEYPPSRQVVFELAHPVDLNRMAAALEIVANGRSVEKFEFRLRHKAGGWRQLLAHAEPVMDGQGNVVKVRGSIMDITEQRRLQQALLDSHTTMERRVQERTRHLQDVILRLGEEVRQRKKAEEALKISDQIVSATSDGMCMIDRSYVYRAVNDSYVRRTGLRREDVLGRHVSAVLGPDNFNEHIRPRLDKSLEGHSSHYTDWCDIPGLGLRCLDIRGFPCRNEAGYIVGVVVNARDITERETVQQALRDSEVLHRTIFDRANMGILRIHHTGRIMEANREACRILGLGEDELRGRSIEEFRHPDDVENDEAAPGDLTLGSPGSTRAERRFMRPDGTSRLCFMAVSTVRDGQGKTEYLIATISDISESKRTEEDLLVYRQMVSSSSDIMIMLDRDHRYRAVNTAFCEWFGRRPEDVIGLTPEQTLGPEAYHTYLKTRLDACLTGKVLRISEWRDFPAKGRCHTDVTYSPCRDGRGNIIGVLIISRDDTEAHNALLNLMESEHNYRLLFDNIRDAVSLNEILPNGLPGPFEDVNKVSCRITGYSREELLRRSPTDLSPPEDASRIGDVMAQLKDKGHALREIVQIGKDGRTIPLEVHAVLFDRDGRRMILSVARDITHRKQAESALRESESRFRQMFDAAGDIIIVHDLKGRITDANRTAHERLGYSREELLGKTIAELGTPESLPLLPVRILELDRRGEATFNLDFQRKDGSHLPMEISARLIEHQGKPAVIGVARDMTEHQRLEGELRQARQDAEEANQAKSGFLAAMSHEIRTSLNSLLGMLALARMADGKAECDACLDTARESADRLLRTLSDILDLSHIESSQANTPPESADPREILDFASRLFIRQARGKGLNLTMSVSEAVPPRVACDTGHLKQLLVSLTGNAVKRARSGEVRLSLDAEPAGPGLSRLRLRVSDTSHTVPRATRGTLIDPLGQRPRAPRDAEAAFGPGLAAARELARSLKARLDLDCSPRKGTTVSLEFTVPVKPTKDEPAGAPSPTRPPRRLRVLVAEDDPMNRLAACRLLEKMGHEVEGVEDGSVVLDMLRKGHFDLIFMDVEMPGMDGLEATRRIRGAHSGSMRCDVPVVAMTAHALTGDRERFLEAGMDDYVAKPVTLEALADILARVSGDGIARD